MEEQKRKGRATPFGPKSFPPKSYALTKLAKDILARAAKRAGTSESNVVELLARRHGGDVSVADFR